ALYSPHLSKTLGLTAPQLTASQSVQTHGAVTIGDLARATSLSQATVTTIVTRLERRAHLRRENSHPDRRTVHVALPAAGRQALAGAPAPLQEELVRELTLLEPWEQSMILSSLQRVARMMDAEDIDASPVLDVGDLGRGTGRGDAGKTGGKL